ncbi:ankyrin repeat domain-containing protein [Hyphomicrobium sp.]|uniref:ankyrin repeat domain-containing protein n=1 Tax=Hyphomicrobium sp. TaxID=82 RepID=UPI002E2F7948|nr:ankyrin repeat domain-containing protein [Hyphomicrobium sp.]HEX2842259.1 ankyrin repeat domain-containing protein [Hyphomicrobium sp.]
MSRTLTPESSLELLKKEAKRWLKALRAGDPEARRRLVAATPAAPVDPSLRDVQLALAREHGLPGWADLRQELFDLAMSQRSLEERVDIVLRSAWGGDLSAALRILSRWPEIATHDLYIAAAAGNPAEVERRLAADPGAATRKGGPLDWEPLLYVAYARLPDGERYALDVARILLDHGANANAQFDDGWGNPFKVLTGAIGQGEGDKRQHPQAHELALLLIERGADPYDFQSLYNTSITRDATTWLDFLWAESERRDRLEKWRDPATKIGGNVPLCALDYLLGNAVAYNHILRAEWLLTHGANADGVHAYSGRPLREEALIYGHAAMAELLVRCGASVSPLEGQAAFQAACMRGDRDAARRLADQHPECLHDPAPMLTAARQGRADVVELLLELGMDVDVADEIEQRGLQVAVAGGSLEVVKLLVAHGADIDRPTTSFGGGAMGYAAHFDRREIATFLMPLSRDVLELTYLGMAERVRELFAEDPQLANAVSKKFGVTPLFCLPDDEDAAAEMTTLLIAHGADPRFANKDGLTAEQVARKRGLIDAADLIAGGEMA